MVGTEYAYDEFESSSQSVFALSRFKNSGDDGHAGAIRQLGRSEACSTAAGANNTHPLFIMKRHCNDAQTAPQPSTEWTSTPPAPQQQVRCFNHSLLAKLMTGAQSNVSSASGWMSSRPAAPPSQSVRSLVPLENYIEFVVQSISTSASGWGSSPPQAAPQPVREL